MTPREAWITEKIRRRTLLKTAGSAGKHPLTAKLVLAADQFIITPITRFEDMIRIQMGQVSSAASVNLKGMNLRTS